jgi:hypothetical protein
MPHQNTNTNAPSDTCLQCVSDWDKSSLESIASASKCTQFGSPSRMTSLSNGDLEIEVSGARGYEHQDVKVSPEGYVSRDCEDTRCTEPTSNSGWYQGGWE